jgi:hypothetical protein
VGITSGFTIEGWINPSDVTDGHPIFEWNSGNYGVCFWVSHWGSPCPPGALYANIKTFDLQDHPIQSADNIVIPGIFQHVALTYDPVTGYAILYRNGAVAQQQPVGGLRPFTAANAYIAYRPYDGGAGHTFSGQIDELTIFNRALSQTEITNIYTAGSAGKCTGSSGGTCTTPPSNLVSWWAAEGSTADAMGYNNGTPLNGLSYAPGAVGTAFSFSGSASTVKVPVSATLDVGASSGFSIEGWINPSDVTDGHPIFEWNSGFYGVCFWVSHWGDPSPPGALYADIKSSNFKDHAFQSANNVIIPNTYQHVALTYDKTTGNARLYAAGSIVAEKNLGTFVPFTGADAYIGYRPYDGGAGHHFVGQIDELTLYNKVLTPQEVTAIWTAGAAGKCSASQAFAPTITTQPQSSSVCQGSSGTLSVIATASPPPTYQWRKDGQNISGATASVYTKQNVQTSDAGSYSVVVSNNVGSVTSASATWTVYVPVAFGTQPMDATACPGGSATFTVTATGSAPLTYQWLKNGTVLPGKTGTSLALNNLQAADCGTYSVIVANACGGGPSRDAILKFIGPSVTAPSSVDYTENEVKFLFLSNDPAKTAKVSDVCNSTYNGSRVDVYFDSQSGQMQPEDELSIYFAGNAVSLESTYAAFYANPDDPGGLYLNGVKMGTFTGGSHQTPLSVTFNTNATVATLDALVKNVLYHNLSENPNLTPRQIHIQVTDGAGGTSVPTTTTVNLTPINEAPWAFNLTFFTPPTASIAITLLAGDAETADPAALTYTVLQPPTYGAISGAGRNLTYTPPSPGPGVSSVGVGYFTYRVTDASGAWADGSVTVHVGYSGTPSVYAGLDQTVWVGNACTLAGLPTTIPAGYRVGWSVLSGPCALSVVPSNQATATASGFNRPGVYQVRLTLYDNNNNIIGWDDADITATENKAPVVNAGADRLLQIGSSVTIIGTATDDRTVLTDQSYQWYWLNCPSGYLPALLGQGRTLNA